MLCLCYLFHQMVQMFSFHLIVSHNYLQLFFLMHKTLDCVVKLYDVKGSHNQCCKTHHCKWTLEYMSRKNGKTKNITDYTCTWVLTKQWVSQQFVNILKKQLAHLDLVLIPSCSLFPHPLCLIGCCFSHGVHGKNFIPIVFIVLFYTTKSFFFALTNEPLCPRRLCSGHPSGQ